MNNNTCDSANAPIRGGNVDTRRRSSGRFVAGLAAGATLGVGIGLWLLPRTSGLRQWLDDSARDLGTRAAEHYGDARTKVTAAVDGLASTAQSVSDGVTETVIRGANEGARVASVGKS